MIIFNFRKHSVAFFHAEDDEKVWIEKKSRELSDHDVHQIAAAQRNFSFLDFAYNWSSGLVPPLVLAPRFFEGEIEYGVIAQGGRAFRECFDAFSVVVQNMASLASLSASIDRLDELTLALQKIDDDEAKRDGHEDRITFLEEDSEIVVSDLHLQSPSSSSDKLMLPQGLSFSWGKDPSDRGLLVRKLFFLITLFFLFFFFYFGKGLWIKWSWKDVIGSMLGSTVLARTRNCQMSEAKCSFSYSTTFYFPSSPFVAAPTVVFLERQEYQ